jgi:hypothetical protein
MDDLVVQIGRVVSVGSVSLTCQGSDQHRSP